MTFSNSTSNSSSDAVSVASSNNVAISDPYDASAVGKIVAPKGNTTNVTLSAPVWSGRYATLSITGNRNLEGTADAKNGTGASVAEFSIVAASTVNGDGQLRLGKRGWEVEDGSRGAETVYTNSL